MKRFLTTSVITRILTAILLFLALESFPIGYYKFLRWVVFLVSVYICYISYQFENKINIGFICFGIIALLFNPIIPFYIGKSSWQTADIIASGVFLASIFFIKE